jgi:hypothetical protein
MQAAVHTDQSRSFMIIERHLFVPDWRIEQIHAA